jgi:uncharacterized protein YdeI (YjbR/CyaY-like superfamily)
MKQRDFSRLKRRRHKMPDFVRSFMEKEKLLEAYQARPPYQQNDYIGWINQAKREETKMKRLNQMLVELKQGNIYMKMEYNSG